MKYNKFGKTGLLVSEICLGAMTFGNKSRWQSIGESDQNESNQIIKRSLEAGVNFIDIANIYSDGESEKILGQAVKSLGLSREDLIIATKVKGVTGEGSNQQGLSRHHIFNEVKASLKRLQMDYIDLYQIHGYDPITPFEETLSALNDLVRSGLVRYIGCSNLTAWQIMKTVGISKQMNYAAFDSVQAYYSLVGRELEKEIIPVINDQNLGLMVWSPLAGGFLTGKYRKDDKAPEGARREKFNFPPVNLEKAYPVIDVLDEIAKEHNVSIARVSLAWLLAKKVVTTVIIGAKNVDQLNDNLEATKIELTDSQIERLDKVSEIESEYPHWMAQVQNPRKVG